MASTYSKITVVPPVADGVGVVPVAVSIKAPNGLTATAYTSRDGSTQRTTTSVDEFGAYTWAGLPACVATCCAPAIADTSWSPADVR